MSPENGYDASAESIKHVLIGNTEVAFNPDKDITLAKLESVFVTEQQRMIDKDPNSKSSVIPNALREAQRLIKPLKEGAENKITGNRVGVGIIIDQDGFKGTEAELHQLQAHLTVKFINATKDAPRPILRGSADVKIITRTDDPNKTVSVVCYRAHDGSLIFAIPEAKLTGSLPQLNNKNGLNPNQLQIISSIVSASEKGLF